MKKIVHLFPIITIFISSCIEEQEIFPRSSETIFITVDHDTAIAMYDNQTYILNAETGDSSSTYLWNCNYSFVGNTSQIVVNYPGGFQVDIITDTVNQHYTVALMYSETPMFYPSSFSPNGDGINDFWSPYGTNINLNGFLLKIYDKNDHLLYKTDEFFKPWNGNVEEEACPDGYYYYVVKYTTLNSEKHKDSGMLQLIR